MKRTIFWPPRIVGGRLAMTETPGPRVRDPSASLRQIIRLSLLDYASDHPWTAREGLGLRDPTFAPQAAATRNRLTARVRELFDGLERTRRAKLASVVIPPGGAEELVISVEYTNMETGGREKMEVSRGR